MESLKLTLKFGPAYSQWSDVTNERNHSLADRIVERARATNPELTMRGAMDMASWVHNKNLNTIGYTLI